MAFKASKRSPPKKPEPVPVAEEEGAAPVSSPLSVEDVVGAVADSAKPASSGSGTRSTEPVRDRKAPEPVSYAVRPSSEQRDMRGGFGSHAGGYTGGRPFHSGFRRPFRSGPPGGYHNGHTNGDGAPSRYSLETVYGQDLNLPTETVKGILDCMPEGHGFLRPKFTPSDRDVYISQSQIRRFLLRNGDMVEGQARPPKDNERYWGLLKVEKVNEQSAEEMGERPKFEDLVPIYPNKLLSLETGQLPISTRIIDLVAPIGFGQRGLIVSPPKAGKTTILKELAAGISANYPDVHLMAALIGERPEEVTDISRSVQGEVLASNFDESPSEQTRIAEVALDRAKRLVETGKDVVILLDSITRLARAYNLVVNPSGRTLSGGFDPAALYPAKRFLGAARCVEATAKQAEAAQGETKDERKKPAAPEKAKPRNRVTEGGSLTVIGTALIDTGSRMDDLIYEEFKGTGNMELHLSRALQERRIFPAIDIGRSGTRHDELLLGEEKMKKVGTLRHMLSLLGDEERTLMLIDRLTRTKTNDEFLDSLNKG
ncbi:transcription termination factor Rho [Patescibacteria group bacterium]|nr:transcription termination factor Rho [Patescibacteria group bacterium]